jgi:hypothetical protein
MYSIILDAILRLFNESELELIVPIPPTVIIIVLINNKIKNLMSLAAQKRERFLRDKWRTIIIPNINDQVPAVRV